MQGKKMDPDDSMVGSRPSISVSQENNKIYTMNLVIQCMFYALDIYIFISIMLLMNLILLLMNLILLFLIRPAVLLCTHSISLLII